jgi:hypothetical protein
MVNGERLFAVKLPGVDVAVYELIEVPPVAPPVTVMVVAALLYGRLVPTSATVITGACGIVVAVMLLDAADAAPVPAELVALTVNVYATPDCKPVTVIGDDAPVAVNPPGLDVTV